MSGDIIKGRTSRKIMTVLVAVFAVAMMLAVPVFAAAGADAAEFDQKETGFCAEAKDASNENMAKCNIDSKENLVLQSTAFFRQLFYVVLGPFGTPTVTSEPFTVKEYFGMKIESDKVEQISGTDVDAQNIKIEYVANSSGNLLSPIYEDYGDDYKEAGDAIKGYFKNDVSKDDKLTFTGKVVSKTATKTIAEYGAVDDSKNVMTKSKNINYCYYSIDVTITFVHDGVTKTIQFYSDQKFECDIVSNIDFKNVDIKDLKEGDKYDVTYTYNYSFESGSSYYKVDGSDAKLKNLLPPSYPEYDQPVEFVTASEMNDFFILMNAGVESIPSTLDNITIDKGYSAAESAFSSVASDVALDDILAIILLIVGIVVGIIVIIVILIIVLVVLKKKKKKQ